MRVEALGLLLLVVVVVVCSAALAAASETARSYSKRTSPTKEYDYDEGRYRDNQDYQRGPNYERSYSSRGPARDYDAPYYRKGAPDRYNGEDHYGSDGFSGYNSIRDAPKAPKASTNNGKVINLKFEELFPASGQAHKREEEFPEDPQCEWPTPCTNSRVSVVCATFPPTTDSGEEEHLIPPAAHKTFSGRVIKETPKNMAIGVMSSTSTIDDTSTWQQVKIGNQVGYQVGRISAEITFDESAKSCNPLLKDAVANFTNVPVFALITKTTRSLTPAILTTFKQLAKDNNNGRKEQQDPDSAKVQVASAYGGGASGRMNVDVGGLYRELRRYGEHLEEDLHILRDGVLTFCGVTYVMHGPVELSLTTGGATTKYSGTIDSTLLWQGSLVTLPHFLGSTAPFYVTPQEIGSLLSSDIVSQACDTLQLFNMCLGPNHADVPYSVPGGMQLDMN